MIEKARAEMSWKVSIRKVFIKHLSSLRLARFSSTPQGPVAVGARRKLMIWIGLVFLRAVDTVEADAFSFSIVEDFEGVTVEEENGGAVEVCGK